MKTITFAPPYSFVSVTGPGAKGPFPILYGGAMIAANRSLIAVSCLCEVDGETEVIMGNAAEVDPGFPHAFGGLLDTPENRLEVVTAELESILEMDVQTTETFVKVWTNSPSEPDRVIIGVM